MSLKQQLLNPINTFKTWPRKKQALAFLLTSCALLSATVFAAFLVRGSTISYQRDKFGIVIEPLGMWLREGPSTESERIVVIKRGSVIRIVGETREESTVPNLGTSKWFKVRTRSGHEGYGFGKLFRFTYEDEANQIILRDKSAFEDRLKNLIIRAAQTRIRESGLFPYDNVADLTITTPLEPQSSSSYSVGVDAFMIGALLGVDKQRISTIVNLEMQIDLNQLVTSEVRVRHVDILDYKRLEGVEPGQAVDLLSKIL